MADEIFIADKKTLDEVNKNSKSILNNTKKYFLNNPEQLLYNQYKIFGIESKGIPIGESSYEEKEVISLESKNGGIFRFLKLRVAPSIKVYSGEYNCKNIKVRLIVDDIEYILTQVNNISDDGYLSVKMDISSQGTLNQRLNKGSSELDFSEYEMPESELYATDNTFSSMLNKIKVKKFDNINRSESIDLNFKTTQEKYIKFNKNFKIIVCGEGQTYPKCCAYVIITFLGGIKID